MATGFNILAWRIPWTEEPGGLQSMGLQRLSTEQLTVSLSLRKQISNDILDILDPCFQKERESNISKILSSTKSSRFNEWFNFLYVFLSFSLFFENYFQKSENKITIFSY